MINLMLFSHNTTSTIGLNDLGRILKNNYREYCEIFYFKINMSKDEYYRVLQEGLSKISLISIKY